MLVGPAPATAYLCDDSRRMPTTPPAELASRSLYTSPSAEECRVPDDEGRSSGRKRKRGSMSGLTVFVLAVAAVLLIPIGARGMPHSGDPYGHDKPF